MVKDSHALNINSQTINSEICVGLFGIKIYNTLSFNLFTFCKKGSNQLNAIGFKSTWALRKEKYSYTDLSYLILITVFLCGISLL